MNGRARIGCSSWTSDAWWGRVYPSDLAAGDRLAWYANLWDAVEVDSSYYRAPGASRVDRWASVTPDGFVFALKFLRHLLDPKRGVDRDGIAAFVASTQRLGAKLGPLLLQFPPWFRPGHAGTFLDDVLGELPTGVRCAVELRHRDWFEGETFARLVRTLRARRRALAWSYLTYVDVPAELTADFVYLRFIGDHSSIPAETHGEVRADRSGVVATWAQRFQRALAENVPEGFAFFNNHFAGFAPDSANLFRRAVGLEPVDFRPREGTGRVRASPPAQRRLD